MNIRYLLGLLVVCILSFSAKALADEEVTKNEPSSNVITNENVVTTQPAEQPADQTTAQMNEEKKEGETVLDWERTKPKQPTPPDAPQKNNTSSTEEEDEGESKDYGCKDGCDIESEVDDQ